MELPSLAPQFAPAFRDLMVQVLALEMQTTCKVFRAVPDDAHDYSPHPQTRTAWELAWHIAADAFFLEGIVERRFQPDADRLNPNPCRTGAELADWYAQRFTRAVERVRGLSADELTAPLTLGGVASEGGFTFPAGLHLLFMHLHTVHHRGQLSAYLRPMGAKVPAIYGPSADEAAPAP